MIPFAFGTGQPGRPRSGGRGRPAPSASRWTARSSLDLDTPDDLLLAEELGLLDPADGGWPEPGGGAARAARPATVVALEGIPEIRPGDDLGGLIGDALERCRRPSRAPGPLRADDVLVVTQKVVSKAEGAIVDLTDDRAAARGDRVRASAGTATRARSRSSCARRGGSSGWPTAC